MMMFLFLFSAIAVSLSRSVLGGGVASFLLMRGLILRSSSIFFFVSCISKLLGSRRLEDCTPSSRSILALLLFFLFLCTILFSFLFFILLWTFRFRICSPLILFLGF